MFVAVVYKYHMDTYPKSHRDDGSWSSFLGETKEEAIQQALVATTRWESEGKTDHETGKRKYYGPYQIVVGELTEEVKRFQVELKKFEPEGLGW